MIDYTKIWVTNKKYINSLVSHHLLKEYNVNKNAKNDEYNYVKYTKNYKGVKFLFFVNYGELIKLEILIKPHYYFNNNTHNGNVFSRKNCIKVLKKLKKLFKIPNDAIVVNLEFGLNLVLLGYTSEFTKCFVFHERNAFYSSNEDLPFCRIASSINKEGKASYYKIIKLYWKEVLENDFEFKGFRIEIKSRKSKFINKLSIRYFDDLLKIGVYKILAETLVKEFKKVLILDLKNDMRNLNENEKLTLEKYLNPNTWDDYLSKSRNVFSNHRRKYLKLLEKTENSIHSFLMNSIRTSINAVL